MLPRLLRHGTFALAALASFSAAAQVTIALPQHGEWVLVNGVKAPEGQTITVENGWHQLAFRMRTDYRHNGDIELYTSPVQIVTFEAYDQTLDIDLPEIRNPNQARQFSRNPKFTIDDANQLPIAYNTDILTFEGFQIGRNYEQEIAQYNQTGGKAALQQAVAIANLPEGIEDNKQSAQTAVNSNVGENSATPDSESEMVAEMLNFWWDKADIETRAAFKAQISAE
ncbi:DUF2057 domain-containing protein [Thaumasiovibrio subtropicus]|uniref:YccT family protein n=1 Tax=Thaumasiovibrio subtropicus TaxID=1891207 RepID=UPI000B34F952|nr:DUF2057 domain-containing protein [Thaumasiovibrio subtropicus]